MTAAPCRFTRAGHWCIEHNLPGDHAGAPGGRPATTPQPLAAVCYCSTCTAAILPGEAMTSIRERETVCPACALDESAPIAVEALSVYAPDADLLTLQRASEALTATAGMLAASVAAMARRRAETGRQADCRRCSSYDPRSRWCSAAERTVTQPGIGSCRGYDGAAVEGR